MTVLEMIRPIIRRTYGQSEMSSALAERLAGRVAALASDQPSLVDGERATLVAGICWDWMSGGTTASAVAAQIEAALVKAGY
jgi:hypothetical protein